MVTTTYTYRSDNFSLQRIQVGANLLGRQYGYDVTGNITVINDAVNGENQSFAYDPLDRFTVIRGAYTETYSYNAVGNMTGKAGVTNSYTNAVHAHAVTSIGGEQRYWYDPNGNMTVRAEISGGQRITYTQGWDAENRLVAVTSTLGTTITFTYDADRQRVVRSDISGTTVYIGQYYEVQLSTGITTSYYTFGGQRVAMRTGSSVYWLHGDHLGSASLTTDANGAVVSEMRYYPFGETRYESGVTPTDKRFTSQRQEAGIGLYDYGARFYSPILGRFISADSIVPQPGDPQSLNRYAYVLNNPLRHVDPSGHCLDDVCGIGGGSGGNGTPYTSYGLLTPTSASCYYGQCRMDTRYDQLIRYNANRYQIPPELLATTLTLEAIDDQGFYSAFIDGSNRVNAQEAMYGGDRLTRALGGAKLTFMDTLEREHGSPGIGMQNIHLDTVDSVITYYHRNYPGSAMTQGLYKESMESTILTLDSPAGNTRYAAAYLRQLADQRTGSNSDHTKDLTVNDMAIIYGAYRAGIYNSFGDLYQYRNATIPGPYGQTFMRYLSAYGMYYN